MLHTNSLGKQTTSHYRKGKLLSATGHASASCPAAYREATYDANEHEDIVADFAGNLTDFDYSPGGLLLRKVEAAGTPEARTTTYEWDAKGRITRTNPGWGCRASITPIATTACWNGSRRPTSAAGRRQPVAEHRVPLHLPPERDGRHGHRRWAAARHGRCGDHDGGCVRQRHAHCERPWPRDDVQRPQRVRPARARDRPQRRRDRSHLRCAGTAADHHPLAGWYAVDNQEHLRRTRQSGLDDDA